MRTLVYKAKTCEKCGCTYTPTSSTQAWCEMCLTKTCEWCGKLYGIGKKSRYEVSHYCSKDCARKAIGSKQRGKNSPCYKNGNRCEVITVACTVCGKDIQREKKQAESWDVHFCSNECRRIYQSQNRVGENNPRFARIERVCEWCGNVFQTWPCTVESARFCSKQCRNDWQSDMMSGANHYNWKGGTAEKRCCDMVSRKYKAWRKAVFDRDGYTCQACGDKRGGNLNAHHLKAYKDYPEFRYEVSNGITLCEKCHIKVHSNRHDIQSDPC